MYKSLGRISVYIHNGRSNLPGSFDSGGTGLFECLGKINFIIIKSNQLILIEEKKTHNFYETQRIMSVTFLI